MRRIRRLIGFGIGCMSISSTINADEWMKTYGPREGRCVRQTSDGGYIITGQSILQSSWPYFPCLCLIKTDSIGDTIWTFKDTTGIVDTTESIGYYVEQTADGGYVVAGEYRCEAPFPDHEGGIVKVDSLGSLQWRKIYNFAIGLSCVVQTSDGGYIATGIIESSFMRIGVIRLDSLGDTLWTRMPPGLAGRGHWVTELSDGSYAIVGHYYAGWHNWPMSLIKMGSVGNILWTVDYDTLTYSGRDYRPGSADYTIDGGYIIMGERGIVKVDSVGSVMWEKWISWPSECIEHTFDSGFVHFSFDSGAITIVKLNSYGDSLWSKRVLPSGSSQNAYYIQQTTDSGYIITGSKYNFYDRIVLIKTHAPVGVEETKVAEASKVIEIVPNPVASSISISYYIASPLHIELGIYDVSGKLVKVLEKGKKIPGIHKVIWDANNTPNGVYFCILKQGELVSAEKIVVLKK